jgi:hypothetical protein
VELQEQWKGGVLVTSERHDYPGGASIEIALHDGDGTVDEVVSRGCMVHQEQMDDHYDWIAFYAPDESERYVVRTYAKRGKLTKHGEWEPLA